MSVRAVHRKLVCHVRRPLRIRASGQRSPPPARAPLRSRWAQLPQANRQRLLHLLGHLIERQLSASPQRPASHEEGEHDLRH